MHIETEDNVLRINEAALLVMLMYLGIDNENGMSQGTMGASHPPIHTSESLEETSCRSRRSNGMEIVVFHAPYSLAAIAGIGVRKRIRYEIVQRY